MVKAILTEEELVHEEEYLGKKISVFESEDKFFVSVDGNDIDVEEDDNYPSVDMAVEFARSDIDDILGESEDDIIDIDDDILNDELDLVPEEPVDLDDIDELEAFNDDGSDDMFAEVGPDEEDEEY